MDHVKARRKEEKDQRRKAILDAAKELFAVCEVDSTTIDQIASACHLSRSLIYTYFLDKNHIFLAVVSEALEEMLEDFKRALVAEENGLDCISAIGWAYVSFAHLKPAYYSATVRFQLSRNLVPRPRGKGKEALLERFDSDFQLVLNRADQINQLMASQIALGIKDGSIRKDIGDPLQTALSLWAMTSGLIQTSSAMEQMLSLAYGVGQNTIIAQGLGLAKAGLKNHGG